MAYRARSSLIWLQNPSFAPKPWPVRPAGLRLVPEAYSRELDRVARVLCRIFAQALDLAPDLSGG